VNIRFVAKTSDIRNFSQKVRSDVKTSEVAALGPMHQKPYQLVTVIHER